MDNNSILPDMKCLCDSITRGDNKDMDTPDNTTDNEKTDLAMDERTDIMGQFGVM